MIDPEDLAFLGAGLHHFVEGLGTAVIATEGFFDHQAAALGIGQQPCCGQGTTAAAIELRRHREVEGAIAPGGPQPVDDVQPCTEPQQVLALLQIHRFVKHALGELLPGAPMVGHLIGHGLGHLGPELLIAPGPTGTAQDRELTGQAPLPKQLEQGWNQLAVGEVTAGPEDHDALR